MLIENILDDTADGLELERIKEKISSVYNQMLSQSFKNKKPSGTPEELEEFLASNELSFGPPAESLDSEAENIDALLDKLLHNDSIKPVAEAQKKKLKGLIKQRERTKGLGGMFAL